jgi:hypothetical protein
MLFYILLAVLVFSFCIISHRYPKLDNNISLALLAIIILIGGLRDRIGWDYNSYTTWYLEGNRDYNFEFGFLTLMNVFRYFKLSAPFLFFFFSFFTYVFVYLGIKKYTKEKTLPLVLYVMIPVMFLYSFTYMRQFLAVAIAFYAFSYLLAKKYIVYFLLMFLGISMHYSCIIPFVFFIVISKYEDRIQLKYLGLLIFISFVFSQIGVIGILSMFLKGSHYYFYVSQKHAVPVPIFKLLVFNVIAAFVIWYHSVKGFVDTNKKHFLILYILSIIILNLFAESTELTRIYIYFRIFEIVVLADIIREVWYERKSRIVIFFVFCFYLFPYFRAIKIDSEVGPAGLKLIPYKTIVSREID